jgi:hypothetical protein
MQLSLLIFRGVRKIADSDYLQATDDSTIWRNKDVVAQLVEAMSYKSGGSGFDCR